MQFYRVDIIQVELLRCYFLDRFYFLRFLQEKTPNQNQLINTNVQRYDKGIARQQNYIPGTAEGSTTFVFVQEARTELGIIQVSAESYFTALGGRSGAAAQRLTSAKPSIPSPLLWTWCRRLYKDKTLIKSVLVFWSLDFVPSLQELRRAVHHQSRYTISWFVRQLSTRVTERRFGRRFICAAFDISVLSVVI